MSAFGPQQTCSFAPHMSAFRGKADMTGCGCLLSRSLLGVKRTWLIAAHMSASDPKRTLDHDQGRYYRNSGTRSCGLLPWTTVAMFASTASASTIIYSGSPPEICGDHNTFSSSSSGQFVGTGSYR